jgi:hypothetical protein
VMMMRRWKQITSSPFGHNTLLKDVLDQRLPPPEIKPGKGVAHVAKLAFACLQTDPHHRPTMRQVSTELTTRWPPLPKLFSTMELEDILVHRNDIGWIFTVYLAVLWKTTCQVIANGSAGNSVPLPSRGVIVCVRYSVQSFI